MGPSSRTSCLALALGSLLTATLVAACEDQGESTRGAAVDLVRVVFPPTGALAVSERLVVRGVGDPARVAGVSVDGVVASSTDGFATWKAEVALAPGVNELTVDVVARDGLHDGYASVSATYAGPPVQMLAGVGSAHPLMEGSLAAVALLQGREVIVATDLGLGITRVLAAPDDGVGTSFTPGALVYDRARRTLVSVRRAGVVTIDVDTLARSSWPAQPDVWPICLAPDPGGEALVAIDSSAWRIVRADFATGIWTHGAHVDLAGRVPTSCAIEPGGEVLVSVGQDGGVWRVDLATGAVDDVRTGVEGERIWGAAIDALGQRAFLGMADAIRVVSLSDGAVVTLAEGSLDGDVPLERALGLVQDGDRLLVAHGSSLTSLELATSETRVLAPHRVGSGPELFGTVTTRSHHLRLEPDGCLWDEAGQALAVRYSRQGKAELQVLGVTRSGGDRRLLFLGELPMPGDQSVQPIDWIIEPNEQRILLLRDYPSSKLPPPSRVTALDPHTGVTEALEGPEGERLWRLLPGDGVVWAYAERSDPYEIRWIALEPGTLQLDRRHVPRDFEYAAIALGDVWMAHISREGRLHESGRYDAFSWRDYRRDLGATLRWDGGQEAEGGETAVRVRWYTAAPKLTLYGLEPKLSEAGWERSAAIYAVRASSADVVPVMKDDFAQSDIRCLAADPDGILWTVDVDLRAVLAIDPVTGERVIASR